MCEKCNALHCFSLKGDYVSELFVNVQTFDKMHFLTPHLLNFILER